MYYRGCRWGNGDWRCGKCVKLRRNRGECWSPGVGGTWSRLRRGVVLGSAQWPYNWPVVRHRERRRRHCNNPALSTADQLHVSLIISPPTTKHKTSRAHGRINTRICWVVRAGRSHKHGTTGPRTPPLRSTATATPVFRLETTKHRPARRCSSVCVSLIKQNGNLTPLPR